MRTKEQQSQNLIRAEWAIAMIAILMVLIRMVLSAKLGPGDDESYYWDWSRRLQLSYYDHPGMTAWLIRVGCLIFGDTPLGIRVFGQVCNIISGIFLWKLGVRLFGPVAALIAIVCYLFAPIYSLGGLLMVPDAPMGAAWMVVAYFAWRILGEKDARFSLWAWAGIVMGLGLLSKYTLVLLALSLVLLMLSERDWRKEFARPGFWSAVILASALCLPIILWNVQYDWPTLKYHLHDRQTGGGGVNFTRWGQFWASQAIILSPALFLICLGVWGLALKRWSEIRWRFILVLTFPTFAIFCFQALFAEFKPHWPAPAYTLLFIGAGQWLNEGFGFSSVRARLVARTVIAALVLVVFIPLNLLFHVALVSPVLPKLARTFAPKLDWDPKFDPTNDLYGWDKAFAEAQALRAELLAHGESEPFLSSSNYQLTSQLGFASGERVWRTSPGRDQYTFWQTPEDWKPLVGKNSIYITDHRYERDPRNEGVFTSCEERSPVLFYRGSEVARRFHIWLCRGFLGFR